MNDTPAIDMKDVSLQPAAFSLEGRMTVHYAGPGIAAPTEGTWKGIGLWCESFSKGRLVPTPEIAAKVTELASFTVRRNYVLGGIIFPRSEYASFRSFYSKIENKDQESVVLTTVPVTASAKPIGN
jgi:hypothetical protein